MHPNALHADKAGLVHDLRVPEPLVANGDHLENVEILFFVALCRESFTFVAFKTCSNIFVILKPDKPSNALVSR